MYMCKGWRGLDYILLTKYSIIVICSNIEQQQAWEMYILHMKPGIQTKLKANLSTLAIPTILLANIYSLDDKMDYLWLW